MTTYRSEASVTDGDRYEPFYSYVNAGDVVIDNGLVFTITQGALDCDCGKGLYCPLVTQEVK